MSRVYKFILFGFFLYGSMNPCAIVLAQENTVDLLAERPQVEYKSAGLRDPFQTYIKVEEKKASQPVETVNYSQQKNRFEGLKVQGIIWGTKMPQAIINNRVYIVGDKIDDAEILSINDNGIELSSATGIVSLAAPRQEDAMDKDTDNIPPRVYK